mgnify:CR=1 FL=1
MNDDFYEEILEEWEEDEKKCYYGKYEDMIFLTIDDDGDIINFLTQYGQILVIPRKYCNIDIENNKNFYICKTEPVIGYYIDENFINMLQIMQKYLKK